MIDRRTFILGSALPAFAQRSIPAARPNILIIMAEGLGAWTLGIYGNKEIRTPNIDLLARAGLRFTNHHAYTPVSSPSRATLFTGRLPRQHGLLDYLTEDPAVNPPQGQATPPTSFDKEIMISDVLAGKGYTCGYVGVWGMGRAGNPGHGYKYTCTLTEANPSYTDPSLVVNGQPVQEKGYLAEALTRRACEFLNGQKKEEPFFLVVSHRNPHPPYEGHPGKNQQLYAATTFETVGWESPAANALQGREYLKDTVGYLRLAAAAITALDDQIPPLLQCLNQNGLRDNTLIIFTADRGFLLGRHGLWSDGHASNPFNMYQEVMCTPMIWNWPGKIPVEAVRPELVNAYDFFPTLCDLAEVEPPQDRGLRGNSYLHLVLGRLSPKQQWRNLIFGEFRDAGMIRDVRYKLVARADGEGELYDMRTDTGEKLNLYDNPQFVTVQNALTRELDTWRRK